MPLEGRSSERQRHATEDGDDVGQRDGIQGSSRLGIRLSVRVFARIGFTTSAKRQRPYAEEMV